jgi:hypothetical protein
MRRGRVKKAHRHHGGPLVRALKPQLTMRKLNAQLHASNWQEERGEEKRVPVTVLECESLVMGSQ